MTSLGRKLDRRKKASFRKHLKKTMKKFKSMVKCSACQRVPLPGENIDQWIIERTEEDMKLTCTECASNPGGLDDK